MALAPGITAKLCVDRRLALPEARLALLRHRSTSASMRTAPWLRVPQWLCGSQAPSASDLASAKQEGLNLIKQQIPSYSGDVTQKTFQVPIQSVAAAETVSISFLVDALGEANAVKYFSNYTVSPCFQQALEVRRSPSLWF